MGDSVKIGIAPNKEIDMPELPEVETIKSLLKPIVVSHRITSIDVLRKTTILGDIDAFVNGLVGETFTDVTRIGKFLIFHLTNGKVFLSHLRMEGKYYEIDEKEKNTYFARVVFHLDNGKKLCYDDSRCFGIMKLTDETNWKNEKEIAQLGPEPFNVKDVSYLIERTKRTSLAIKSTLLDQTLMTGLGNIYVDEVLYACNINPLTPAKLIKKEEWENIVKESKRILNGAIKAGGSTIRSYHPGKDIDGNFQTKLLAYGQKDNDCQKCHHPMRFIKVNGRGTTYCPICQVKKGLPISVGIFGSIGSGKTEVLNLFNEAGYSTLSSDDIVAELYKKAEIVDSINKLFNLNFVSVVDKGILREHLSIYPNDKKKLERYIHPLVKKEVASFIKLHPLSAIEVPLMFEAKMESMFDVLIAVDANDQVRYERVKQRNVTTGSFLTFLNQYNNRFPVNKRKADFVITNNASREELKKMVNQIISRLQDRQN